MPMLPPEPPKSTLASPRSHRRGDFTASLGLKFARINSGWFMMGSSNAQIDQVLKLCPYSDSNTLRLEANRHRVEITQPFELAIHQVTVGQFRRFVDDTNYRTDAEKDGEGGLVMGPAGTLGRYPGTTCRNPGFPADFSQTDDHPVVQVSHNDAVAFCAWLSEQEGWTYRLPTEAEWEYACRAGTTTLYPNDSDEPERLVEIANVADASAKRRFPGWTCIGADDDHVFTAPVGSFRPNDWGLYDMIGNVKEWCADWYDEDCYRVSPLRDPAGPSDKVSARVLRGGGWHSNGGSCRSANRGRLAPDDRADDLGFRVVAVRAG